MRSYIRKCINDMHIKKKNKENEKYSGFTNIEEPELYNTNGEQMNVWYLRDNQSWTYPYSFTYGRMPLHLFWDRYSFRLPIHVYSHNYITETKGNPQKKYAYLIESEAIFPGDYEIFDRNPGLSNEFDKIFTHSAKILNNYSNAIYVPAAGVYYGTKHGGGQLDEKLYLKKDRNISIVSSDKNMCHLHKVRMEIARYLKNTGKGDVFGTFDGGKNIKIAESLTNYRYSFAIENNINEFYFTEKLLNCFASMTIPIYLGAEKIDKFFNKDGIIIIKEKDLENIDNIIDKCNKADYEDRKEAILDNFERVKKYLCVEDFLYETYPELFSR